MDFWARLTGAVGKVKYASEFAKRAIEQGAAFYVADADAAAVRLSFGKADVVKIVEGDWAVGEGHSGDAKRGLHGVVRLARRSLS